MAKTVFGKTAARAALSIATVLLLTLSFNSCKKDNIKTQKPEHPKNTLIIDGVKTPVLKAAINKTRLNRYNEYIIYLYFSEDEKEYMDIWVDGEHHGGKTIDLTKKEDGHAGRNWMVDYFKHSQMIFHAHGSPLGVAEVFQNGTLFIKRTGETLEFEIKLENGKVKYESKEHTVSLLYKGKLELVEK